MSRLFLLIVAAALTGCATRAPRVIKLTPPSVLLEECLHPEVRVAKNKDLVEGLLAYKLALDLCNEDKKALRDWAEE